MTESGYYPGKRCRSMEIETKCSSRFSKLFLDVKGKMQAAYREEDGDRTRLLFSSPCVAFPMRDFLVGPMRPRDFSAFSPIESGKRPRVHATEARAYTRSNRERAATRERKRAETSAMRERKSRRIGRQKWKRTVASRTRVSCGASTRCRGNNR